MKAEQIREQLYQRYIAPTKRDREDFIGVEIEMPILNLDKQPVDFSIVHKITEQFMDRFGFQTEGRDEEGNIYAARDLGSGDILSYDCSYNNLELSMGKTQELHTLSERFNRYYKFLEEAFVKYHYTLTGMGVNPYRKFNRLEPIPNGRYRMLLHHLCSYKKYDLPMYFHDYPTYGLFSSASQVQLDVHYEDLLTMIRAFSRLEPIKALLFSNSVLLEEHEELQCCRDMFWEYSTHGINPHNIGMFECEIETEEDLLSYIASTSIYCVERGDKYINFSPLCIMDYLQKESVEGEYFDGESYQTITVIPRMQDIDYLRTFKFEDLTFRGTMEFRSVCCQPIADSMTVAAFHLGLKEKVYELDRLLEQDQVIYHRGYTATELRRQFVKSTLPPFVEPDAVYALAEQIVDLAKEGLQERGFQEEIYLKPLYQRIRKRTNPARELMMRRKQGEPLEQIILSYA